MISMFGYLHVDALSAVCLANKVFNREIEAKSRSPVIH